MPENNIIIRANALYIIIFFLYELLYTEYIYLRNFSYLFPLVIGTPSLRSVTTGSIALLTMHLGPGEACIIV